MEEPEPEPEPVEVNAANDDALEVEDAEEPGQDRRRSRKKKATAPRRIRQLGDDELFCQPRTKSIRSKWLEHCDKMWPEQPIVPSAKTTAVKNQVLKWQAEAPNDKIISKSESFL